MTRDALQQVIKEAARLLKDIEQQDRGTTHWAGCEQSHPRCRTRAVIGQFLTLVRDLQQENRTLTQQRDMWREAYDGTDHAQEQAAWQHERNYVAEEFAKIEAEVTRLTALIEQAPHVWLCSCGEPLVFEPPAVGQHDGIWVCRADRRHPALLAVPRESQLQETEGDPRVGTLSHGVSTDRNDRDERRGS